MKNKKLNIKNLIKFNKYTFLLIFIYCLLGIGVTYAYLAFRVENNSVITGNVIAIDVELEVERVVGTNDDMVPLNGDALSNALNGVGSTNGACVDNVGNLSCQVYKITLNNIGSRIKHIDGTIELYAKDGQGNVYNNLMWREITNPTTIKEDAIFHTMEKSKLVSDLTMESKEVRVWYIAVWINEIEENQLDTDKGDFGGIVTFESFEVQENAFVEEVMEPNAQSDSSINFSQTSQASNTNGIYLRSGTENDTYPIYYYRGNVNNNLIFAGFCWKVVRSTETGGLKLLYNGVPSNGQCNNTREATTIGDKSFNENYNSPAYVGYMYGNPYPADYRDMASSTQYVYGNGVNYSNGTYTLTNTKTATWSSVYESGLTNHHYTCFTTGTTCASVYYIYNTGSDYAYYLTLTGVNNIETALSQMLDNNTYSSTIKGNNTTEGTLDYWYYTNIEQKGYSSYIEDTIWCNDRSIYSLGGFNPNGGSTYLSYDDDEYMNAVLLHSTFEKYISETPTPNLNCSRNVDRFTVSQSNGNGALDYPVGLLTADEILLAGADNQFNGNSSYYLYNNYWYWAGSPFSFDSDGALESGVGVGGHLGAGSVGDNDGVRPSVSLKPGFSLTGTGNGSATSPYIVQ